jgi:hypothetical protein
MILKVFYGQGDKKSSVTGTAAGLPRPGEGRWGG